MKEFKVERDILFYALRYSLGRQTFAPTIVIENIKHNINGFSIHDLETIKKEVLNQEKFGYGMECDKNKWIGFVEYLTQELKKRGERLNGENN